MTPREQIALFLFTVTMVGITVPWGLVVVWEAWGERRDRERTWRAIDLRCARERHPSYQEPIYDWAKEEW